MCVHINQIYIYIYIYSGASLIQTSGHLHCLESPIGHVACSLLTVMKFGLGDSTRREPKGWFGGLFILLMITNTWLLGDDRFLQ